MNSVPEIAFFLLVSALTLAGLAREFRLQYVFTISVVMYAISAGAVWVAHGNQFLGALMFTIFVLNSRGVSRLILKNLQDRVYYGWYVMGITTVIATVLEWLFLIRRYDVPLLLLPGVSLLMQFATVPWLIKRKPGSAPGFLPVITLLVIVAAKTLGYFVFLLSFTH